MTEYPPSSTTTEPWEDDEDDTVPIIVGSVLSGIIILTLIGYLIVRFRQR